MVSAFTADSKRAYTQGPGLDEAEGVIACAGILAELSIILSLHHRELYEAYTPCFYDVTTHKLVEAGEMHPTWCLFHEEANPVTASVHALVDHLLLHPNTTFCAAYWAGSDAVPVMVMKARLSEAEAKIAAAQAAHG